jgi:general secretion pathway protein A
MGLSTGKNIYGEHFGLLEFPFGITPNPRFSYNNSFYREAFAKLYYGIEARKGFIVITGEVGTGKTTLLKAFMQSVESTVHTAFIFNPKMDFSQLIRSILTDLGVACSSEDRFTLIEKLNDYLIDQLKKDHIVAILVDEAQDLSDELLEEIRLLSNLETDSSRLVQIVLMGQPEFERRLDQPELRQLKQRIALRCRLAPLRSGEIGPYINHRLKKAGYQGKELFEAKAVERIGLNSQGIPRLINVICDNALLIAYASSKKQVSVEMVEEVARDLKLTLPSRTQRSDSLVDFQKPRGRDKGTRDEVERDDARVDPASQEFFMEEQPPEPYPKRKAKRLGIFLGLVLMTGIGVAIYAQKDGDVMSAIAVGVEDFSARSRDYFSDSTITVEKHSPQAINYLSALAVTLAAKVQQMNESVSEIAVKIGDYFHEHRDYLSRMPATIRAYSQQGWDYLSEVAVKAKISIAAQWENLKHVNMIPNRSQDNSNTGLEGFLDQRSNDRPAPAAEESTLITESKEADKEAAPGSGATEIEPPQPPETVAGDADGGETLSEKWNHLKPQPLEPDTPLTENEPLQAMPKKESQPFVGNFEVVQDSFLRDKPESDAAITILPPGTRVRVEGKNGNYLHVRSLSDPALRGYVHLEDAFFERIP